MKRLPSMLACLSIAACAVLPWVGAGARADTLRVGFMPGPYRDAFTQGIAPQLQRKGYAIEYVEFSQGVQINESLNRGEIDANIMQHTLFLEASNERQKLNLAPLIHVPTPPMGLYSKRYKTLAEVPDGSAVAIPSDPLNAARALNLLAAQGWIKVKPGVAAISISERDVVENPHRLRLIPLDSAQAPRALDDTALAAIQGNFAVAYGLRLTDALALENMTLPYVNVVAVKRRDLQAPFAQDIAQAYRSSDFQRLFRANPVWAGYRLPDYFAAP